MFVSVAFAFGTVAYLISNDYAITAVEFCKERGYDNVLEHSESLQKVRCSVGFTRDTVIQDYRYERNFWDVLTHYHILSLCKIQQQL